MSSIPDGAVYVTTGALRVVSDVGAVLGAKPGERRFRYHTGQLPPEEIEPRTTGFLVLAADRLRVLFAGSEVWSAHAGEVTDLDAHQRSGFVIVTRRGDGVIAGLQRPVPAPPGAGWRTVGRLSNIVGGWDKQLRTYGVNVHF